MHTRSHRVYYGENAAGQCFCFTFYLQMFGEKNVLQFKGFKRNATQQTCQPVQVILCRTTSPNTCATLHQQAVNHLRQPAKTRHRTGRWANSEVTRLTAGWRLQCSPHAVTSGSRRAATEGGLGTQTLDVPPLRCRAQGTAQTWRCAHTLTPAWRHVPTAKTTLKIPML